MMKYSGCASSSDSLTSSTSTRVTSGSDSAPFFLLFFAFPPPCSSPATASRNLFWPCAFWDLRTKSWCVLNSGHPLVWISVAPFPLFTHISHSISSWALSHSADSDRWHVSTCWGSSRCLSLHAIWVPFLVVSEHVIKCYTSHCCTQSHQEATPFLCFHQPLNQTSAHFSTVMTCCSVNWTLSSEMF